MKTILSLSLAAATVLGAAALPTGAAFAASSPSASSSPLVLVASGGWAARVSGKNGAYDGSYEGYGAGAYPYQPYARAYSEPVEGYGAVGPSGYGYDGYANDVSAY